MQLGRYTYHLQVNNFKKWPGPYLCHSLWVSIAHRMTEHVSLLLNISGARMYYIMIVVYMHVVPTLCNRWLQGLPRLVDISASSCMHHQGSWYVISAFLWLAVHTKWHAVGGSTAKPAWMNIRNTPTFAQTVSKEERTLLIPEVSRIQGVLTLWNEYLIFFT